LRVASLRTLWDHCHGSRAVVQGIVSILSNPTHIIRNFGHRPAERGEFTLGVREGRARPDRGGGYGRSRHGRYQSAAKTGAAAVRRTIVEIARGVEVVEGRADQLPRDNLVPGLMVETTRVLLSYVSRDVREGRDACVGAMPLGA
jgi:hypothetical protein